MLDRHKQQIPLKSLNEVVMTSKALALMDLPADKGQEDPKAKLDWQHDEAKKKLMKKAALLGVSQSINPQVVAIASA